MDYAAYYSHYRRVADGLPLAGPAIDYDWSGLAGSAQCNWPTYGMMSQEFARELSNSINELTILVGNLSAWKEVIGCIEDDGEKLGVLPEFVLAQEIASQTDVAIYQSPTNESRRPSIKPSLRTCSFGLAAYAAVPDWYGLWGRLRPW